MSQKSTMDRRTFLRNSSLAAITLAVPSWVWGCGGAEAVKKNEAWEKKATDLEGKGTVLTKAEPGKWKEKIEVHLPKPTFNKGANSVDVVVTHPMTKGHWISDIYVKNQDGIVVGLKSWEAKDYTGEEAKQAKATFTLPAGTTSITAYAYCNLHDHWKAVPTQTT